MTEKYQLGVDIGTSANAMFAFTKNSDGDPENPLYHELMIFGEPVEGEQSKLKSVNRREKRLQRRRVIRRAARLRKIWHIANACGIASSEADEKLIQIFSATEGFETQGYTRIWELRARAARQKIELTELFMVVALMAKHRGYSSSPPKLVKEIQKQLDAGKPIKKADKGSTSLGLCITSAWMKEHPDLTPAELLLLKKKTGELKSILNLKKNKDEFINGDLYSFHRDDYKKELDKILAEQKKHHSILSAPIENIYGAEINDQAQKRQYFWGQRPKTISDAIRLAAYYQYPLKGFEHLIGTCSLEPGEGTNKNRRILACHPAAVRFQALKTLGDLRWKRRGELLHLYLEQEEMFLQLVLSPHKLKAKANTRGKVAVDVFYEALEQAGIPKPEEYVLSIDTVRERAIVVDNTQQIFSDLGVWDTYSRLSEQNQGLVFQVWGDLITETEDWGYNNLRDTVSGRFGQAVTHFFDELNSKNSNIPNLESLGFRCTRLSYGAVACQKLCNLMESEGLDEYKAREKLYPAGIPRHHSPPKSKSDFEKRIPLIIEPGADCAADREAIEVINPTVRRSLQELRKAMIRKFTKFGAPDSVTIEMARETKNSPDQRREISLRQSLHQDVKDLAIFKLKELGLKVSQENIERLILLWEQGSQCPYTGLQITEAEAIDGRIVHKEHIIPINRVNRANARRFLVLSKASFNLEKSDAPNLYAFFAAKGDLKAFDQICERLNHLEKSFPPVSDDSINKLLREAFRNKKSLIQRKSEYGSDQTDEEFSDRQLVETAYIGRVAIRLFESVCPVGRVFGSRGKFTGLIRSARMAGLDSILEEVLTAEGILNPTAVIKLTKTEQKQIEALNKAIKKLRSEGHTSKASRLETRLETIKVNPCGLFYERKNGNLVLNKRIDHRQHLIDACSIALSTRKLLKSIQAEELKAYVQSIKPNFTQITVNYVPSNLREKLLKIIRNYVVVPKPDRRGGGALLDATAYGEPLESNHTRLVKTHIDRNGKEHKAAYAFAGFVAARLSSDKERSKALRFNEDISDIRDDELLVYKNDVLHETTTDTFWRVGLFSGRDGLMTVRACLSATFDELKASETENKIGYQTFSFKRGSKNLKIVKNAYKTRV